MSDYTNPQEQEQEKVSLQPETIQVQEKDQETNFSNPSSGMGGGGGADLPNINNQWAANMVYYTLGDENNTENLETLIEKNGEDTALNERILAFVKRLVSEDTNIPAAHKPPILALLTVEMILEEFMEQKRKKIEEKRGKQKDGNEHIFSADTAQTLAQLMGDLMRSNGA